MRVLVLLATVLVAFVSVASATPLCLSGGTMASYVALGSGGCAIGDKLFSNFVYGSTGHGTGVAVPATQVFLTPVGGGSFNPGPGIIFSSAAWIVPSASATTTSFVDSSFGFTVSVFGGSPIIEDGTLTLSSFAVTGTGTADIVETINPAGIQLQVDTTIGPLVSHGSFTPTNTVSVLKDLLVFVPQGTSSGNAQINSFEEDFSQISSQVPEPTSLALLAVGLVGLAGTTWRRHRRK